MVSVGPIPPWWSTSRTIGTGYCLRWRGILRLLTFLLEFLQHIPQLVITEMHLRKYISNSARQKNVLYDSLRADYVAICTNSDSLFHQNDLLAVDPNPTQTDMRHRYHIHVIFGGLKRQTCLSAVVALAVPWKCHQQAQSFSVSEGQITGTNLFLGFFVLQSFNGLHLPHGLVHLSLFACRTKSIQ